MTNKDHETDQKTGKIVICRFSDGKPGHEHQTTGLLDALQSRLGDTEVEIYSFDVSSMRPSVFGLQHFFTNPPDNFPKADLWIAAGRTTHQHILPAAKYLGGHAVVCMDPGRRPRRRFDLCLIPEHDGIPESDNVILTKGALNHVMPSDDHDPSKGVILIGGPSKHYRWDHKRVCAHVVDIVTTSASVQWDATTSRRTPKDTEKALCEIQLNNLQVTPAWQTPEHWVADRLALAGQCWVTEDSVSMVYEAMTAGARVGILPVPRRRTSRVARGIDALIEHGQVTRWAGDQSNLMQSNDPTPLHEADRCAAIIIERFLS